MILMGGGAGGYRTLDDFLPLKGRKVLLRVDINSSIINGKPEMSERMEAHAKTIKELCRKGAAVAVLAHQGRPGEKDFTSLEKHARLMRRLVKVSFVKDTMGGRALKAIKNLKPGNALLLENVRMLREEFQPFDGNPFISRLALFFDLFVLDALSVAHRNEASVTGFAARLPHCMGPVMRAEVESISRLVHKTKKPYTVIFGGVKLGDYFGLFEHLMKKGGATKVLTCGIMGELFLIARGVKLGEKEKFLESRGLMELLPEVDKLQKAYGSRIEAPVDVAIEENGRRKVIGIGALPSERMIYDIGPKTAEMYAQIIRKSASIFLKGVPGAFEKKGFEEGTREVLSAIAASKGFSLIGGGESSTAIGYLGIKRKRIGYVSLSGGALLKMLAGERLPGLEAMKR
jgi:phosphoglycerate kinase